jgi:hypothetical protein
VKNEKKTFTSCDTRRVTNSIILDNSFQSVNNLILLLYGWGLSKRSQPACSICIIFIVNLKTMLWLRITILFTPELLITIHLDNIIMLWLSMIYRLFIFFINIIIYSKENILMTITITLVASSEEEGNQQGQAICCIR